MRLGIPSSAQRVTSEAALQRTPPRDVEERAHDAVEPGIAGDALEDAPHRHRHPVGTSCVVLPFPSQPWQCDGTLAREEVQRPDAEAGNGLPDRVCRKVPEQPRGLVVPIDDVAEIIDGDHRRRQLAEEAGIESTGVQGTPIDREVPAGTLPEAVCAEPSVPTASDRYELLRLAHFPFPGRLLHRPVPPFPLQR
jgi:hypothetical protein